jgi:alpha(1,3/1,4) fucosyltransferase
VDDKHSPDLYAQQLLHTQARPKKIYIIPGFWGELFAIDNPIFNRDNCLEVLYRLRETARKAGYEIYQADHLESIEDFEYLIVFDVFPDQLKLLERFPKEKKILFLWEPPSVIPDNYILENHRDFAKVMTWHDDLIDNEKYFKFFYPVIRPAIDEMIDYSDKRLCTLIACNKDSSFPGELYSERRALIQFYENSPHDDFTLYGKWWPYNLTTYAGPIDKKADILKNYRFSFAYENIRNISGYITEKIFDCFQVGTVPIYWGAPNISSYIPKNCYISREDFADNTALYSYIKNMDATKYEEYQKNIRNYLQSPKAQLYSQEHFISLFMNLISTPNTESL